MIVALRVRDLATIARVTGGALRGPGSIVPSGWSIDTRTLKPGDFFFAIVGPNHDAHRFVDQSMQKGASAAVISDASAGGPGPAIVVADTLRALQDLAAAWRRSLPSGG